MTCPRAGKWFGACRFEARYDVGALVLKSVESGDILGYSAPFYPPTRVVRLANPHDICTRCGKVVERTQSKEA